MKKLALILALLCLPACILAEPPATQPAAKQPAATQPAGQDGIRVFFSPHGGCTAAIVEQIGAARKTIDL